MHITYQGNIDYESFLNAIPCNEKLQYNKYNIYVFFVRLFILVSIQLGTTLNDVLVNMQ